MPLQFSSTQTPNLQQTAELGNNLSNRSSQPSGKKRGLKPVCNFLSRFLFTKNKQAIANLTPPSKATKTTQLNTNNPNQKTLNAQIEEAISKNKLDLLIKLQSKKVDWAMTTESGLNLLEFAIATAKGLKSLGLIDFVFSKTADLVEFNPKKVKSHLDQISAKKATQNKAALIKLLDRRDNSKLGISDFETNRIKTLSNYQPQKSSASALHSQNSLRKSNNKILNFSDTDVSQNKIQNILLEGYSPQKIKALQSNHFLTQELSRLEDKSKNPFDPVRLEVAIKRNKMTEFARILQAATPEDLNTNLPQSGLKPIELALAHACGTKYLKLIQTLFKKAELSNTELQYSPSKSILYKTNPNNTKALKNKEFSFQTINPKEEKLVVGKDGRTYSATQAKAIQSNHALAKNIFPDSVITRENNKNKIVDAILNNDLSRVKKLAQASINWEEKTASGLTPLELAIASAKDAQSLELIHVLLKQNNNEHQIDRIAILNHMHIAAGGEKLIDTKSTNPIDLNRAIVTIRPEENPYLKGNEQQPYDFSWNETLALSVNPQLHQALLSDAKVNQKSTDLTNHITKAINHADLATLIKLSLLENTDFNAPIKNGMRPLDLALTSKSKHAPEMIRFLIHHGADVSSANPGKVNRFLIKYNKDNIPIESLQMFTGLSIEQAILAEDLNYIKSLTQGDYNLNNYTPSGLTPLELAQATNPKSDLSRFLLHVVG